MLDMVTGVRHVFLRKKLQISETLKIIFSFLQQTKLNLGAKPFLPRNYSNAASDHLLDNYLVAKDTVSKATVATSDAAAESAGRLLSKSGSSEEVSGVSLH